VQGRACGRFLPIADRGFTHDDVSMRRNLILHGLSRRTPVIVVLTLCAALLGYWTDAPEWLPYGLAAMVACVALILMAARDRRIQSRTEEEPGSNRRTSWISYELAGNGTPSGTYLLGFFSLVTIMLTGVEGAYAIAAWAALALCAAWGIANAHYPTDEEPGP
jgi:hypothetical protein